jgi:dipeptide/tripeptide permease
MASRAMIMIPVTAATRRRKIVIVPIIAFNVVFFTALLAF